MKAILRKGAIVPVDPVPAEWREGTVLEVAKMEDSLDPDAWAKMMNELCADSRVEDEERMQGAINKHREEAKAQARRDMGLSA